MIGWPIRNEGGLPVALREKTTRDTAGRGITAAAWDGCEGGEMRFLQASVSLLSVTVAAFALASCGGGGGSSSSAPPPPPVVKNASPGGIWKGTTSGGQVLVGLVTESGEFSFLQDDGVQYFCNMMVSGNAASASFTGITQVGTMFPNGSTSGTGTLTATIAERSTLTGSITFATAGGTPTGPQKILPVGSAPSGQGHCGSSALGASAYKVAAYKSGSFQTASTAKLFDRPPAASPQAPAVVTGTFTLTYDPLYDRDSSLATITGNFREPNGTVVTVDANGNIFSQDAATGCVLNGRASVIDSRYNAYQIQYTFGSCTGQLTALNGATFTGLATLDNTASPEQAIVAVTAQSGNASLGLIEVLDRI